MKTRIPDMRLTNAMTKLSIAYAFLLPVEIPAALR